MYGNPISSPQGMYDTPTQSNFDKSWNSGAYDNTVGDTAKKGIVGGATGWLGSLMMGSNAISPGAGFLLSGLISVGGSLLNSLFGRRPKVTLSPEQQYFKDLTNFYSDLGAKTRTARAVASVYGVKPEKVAKIGYNNFNEMWDVHGDAPKTMKKTQSPVTVYDEGGK